MLDQRLENLDRILLVLALIGACVFGGVLLRDDWLLKIFRGQQSGDVVGHVVSSQNDVRRRVRRSLTWYETFNNEELYELDSLFTGSDSKMTITLNNEQSLDLDSNSLVVLRTKGGELLLDLQIGSVVSYSKTPQIIKVINNGEITEIRTDQAASPLRINKNSKGKISVRNRSGLELVKVKPAEPPAIKIVPKKIEAPKPEAPLVYYGPPKPPPIAGTPLASQPSQKVILKFKPGVDVRSPASVSKALTNAPNLAWNKIENARDYSVEISSTPKFENPLVYDPLVSSGLQWNDVRPGQYYWRVKARGYDDTETQVSPPAKLTVQLEPPNLSGSAVSDETTELPEQMAAAKNVNVNWPALPMAAGYRFIASEGDVETQNILLKTTTAEVKIPPGKAVEIRVAAVDHKGKLISDFSSLNRQFKRELIIKAPEIILPEDKTTAVAFDKKRIDPLLFSWRAASGAKDYELQFAADPEFKNILSEKRVSSNKFILKEKISNGEVFWRVRSHFEKSASNWTAPRSYELQNGH